MADQKISELTALTGANVADDDAIAIVDTSATETKKIVFSELKNALDSATGFVRITGDTMTGDLALSGADVTFGDNDKALFGAGSDLKIYHDGSDSYVLDDGNGDLILRGSNNVKIQGWSGSAWIDQIATADNADVALYYSTNLRLATTSTGVDITGTLTSDGLTVDGTGVVGTFSSSNNNTVLRVKGNGATNGGAIGSTSTDDLVLLSGLTEKMLIDSSGNVGIGTSSPNSYAGYTVLTVDNATNGGVIEVSQNDTIKGQFYYDGTQTRLRSNVSTDLAFDTNDTEAMRIDSSGDLTVKGGRIFVNESDNGNTAIGLTRDADEGYVQVYSAGSITSSIRGNGDSYFNGGNVGIGTDSPSRSLHISGGTNSMVIERTDATTSALLLVAESNNTAIYSRASNASTTARDLVFNMGSTEAMRIDSSGNVGIGTSSPSSYPVAPELVVDTGTNGGITIKSGASGSSYGGLYFADGTTGDEQYRGFIQYEHNNASVDALLLGTAGTERMRIDSNGRVGITAAPEFSAVFKALELGPTALVSANNTNGRIVTNVYYDGSYKRKTDGVALQYEQDNAGHLWYFDASGTADAAFVQSEVMRLDSSGNLIVGDTSAGGITTGGKFYATPSSGIYAAANADNAGYFNRNGGDGSIVEFRAGNAPVGSIGVEGGDLVIGTGTNCGLQFNDGNAAIRPFNIASNAAVDNAVDLGVSGTRFKDLYLSGGVYLGGTGSANKLDDYEEGTWTPTVTASSGTITTQSGQVGTYTKIGREVSLHFQFSITNIGSASGNIIVSNLPFAKETATITYYLGIHRARSGTSSITEMDGTNLQLYGTTPINSTYIGSITYTST